MPPEIAPPPAHSAQLDASALEAALRRHLRGEVRFDSGSRALYATDGSNYRQVPIGVVIPRDKEDVLATVALCRDHRAPLLARGGGTSLAGQCCNAAVVLDFSKYMAGILEIDPARRIARVEPGVVLDRLRAEAEKHHLTFAPDPATHDRCTLGGMIGNNSCGVHSIMAGKTDDNIEALEVLTYGGQRMHVGATSADDFDRFIREGGRRAEIYAGLKSLADRYGEQVRRQFPNIPRRVSGYNLNHLLPENGFHVARALVGSEGTCVTILEATCRLVESPPARVLLVIGWPDIYLCADHVPQIMEHRPIGLEGFDDIMVNASRRKGVNLEGLALLPEGGGWLMVEFGADTAAEAESQARNLMEALDRSAAPPNMRLFTDPRQARRIWDVRESSLGVTSHVPGEPLRWEGFEDSAVAPDKLGAYLRELRRLMQAFHYDGSFYGHFGHACVHTRMDYDLESTEGVRKFRQFMEEAADLVVRYGGSLSGEHGDGQARGELLPKMFGPELMQAFREFKSLWDPDWKMNPGKLIEPYRLDENLRLGAGYDPWQPETHFKFPDDHGSLASATLRCVGVGKCRRDAGGVMCPSFRVTRDEEHSTRGRAHLLWEMTKGDVIQDGWQNEAVKESLDLCLACKGCKSDCPVGVDVATYKSEFLSHYYETNRRPLNALALSNFDLWLQSRFARAGPGESYNATPRPARPRQAGRRNPRPAPHSGVSPADVQAVVGGERSAGVSPAVGAGVSPAPPSNSRIPSSSGPTLSTITSSPRPPKPPSKCSKPPASTSPSRAPTSAADARSTTSACSTAPRACSSRSWTSFSPKSKPQRPSSSSNPAAPPSSATNLLTFSPKTNARKPSRSKSSCSANFSSSGQKISRSRNCRAGR